MVENCKDERIEWNKTLERWTDKNKVSIFILFPLVFHLIYSSNQLLLPGQSSVSCKMSILFSSLDYVTFLLAIICGAVIHGNQRKCVPWDSLYRLLPQIYTSEINWFCFFFQFRSIIVIDFVQTCISHQVHSELLTNAQSLMHSVNTWADIESVLPHNGRQQFTRT